MSTTVFKKYIPVRSKTTSKVNNLKLEVYYSLGGINYFTYKNEPRGYYLSVSPVERVQHDGYVTESVVLFSGIKKLVKEVAKSGKKHAEDAITISKNYWHELIDYVCQHEELEVLENA